jgi:predicted signal transduction protein with EAL and GGDEF domain
MTLSLPAGGAPRSSTAPLPAPSLSPTLPAPASGPSALAATADAADEAALLSLLLNCLGTARRRHLPMCLLWIEIGLPTAPLAAAEQARVLEDLLLRVRRRIRPFDHALAAGDRALAVVLMGADPVVGQKVAQRLASVLHQPHGLGLRRLPLTARIGVASPPDRGDTAEGLLARARRAV